MINQEALTIIDKNTSAPDEIEANLETRFSLDVTGPLTRDFLKRGIGFDATDRLNGRQFLVAYIDGDSPYADIPKSVETNVFSRWFKMPRASVLRDYGKYDKASTFAAVIDTTDPERPVPAGSLRIIKYLPELGFKDVNDLIVDDPSNPWLSEIKEGYFDSNETYSPALAWERLGQREGVDLSLDKSVDVATHAAEQGYSQKRGSIDSVSMLFYHACLRYALAIKADNLVAIFDIPPFQNLQQFGDPFDTYSGLSPHPYGGPYDTVPAYCVIDKGMSKIRNHDEGIGSIFIDGAGLSDLALMPNEYEAERFSNEAVGL